MSGNSEFDSQVPEKSAVKHCVGLLQTQYFLQTYRTLACFAGREAGDTYSKLAEVHVKQDGKADAAQAYVEASKAYQRVDKSSMQS